MENEERDTSNLSRNLSPAEFIEHEDGGSHDLEVEEKLADWLEVNRVENSQPLATLYKFTALTGDQKEQVDYYRGIIPSRHEIGLNYGAGKYYMIIRNQSNSRGAKATSIRFYLHESYNQKAADFRREKAERERVALPPVQTITPPAIPPQSGKESLIEAVTLVRSMQMDTLAMFRPILERLLTPPASVPVQVSQNKPPNVFEEYALTRQILKDNLKDNVQMFSTMQKALIENKTVTEPEDEEDLPDEKQSMFDKIIALAEPFINILAQNNMAAKMAAAGIKAAPQFKEVMRDTTLARRIISYVEEKEGVEKAGIALRNLGISKADYSPAPIAKVAGEVAAGNRGQAAGTGHRVVLKNPGKNGGKIGQSVGVKKLNLELEVKK